MITGSEPPLVSVITPVFDRASSMKGCLASVSEQTYPNVEHIVVDGGSTDGTLDLVRTFESRHELRWISEPDDGMYDAINKGLEMARGEIVAYVNSDDLYLPWSVEVAVTELGKGTDLIFGDLGVLSVISAEDTRFFLHFYPDFDLKHYTYTGAIGQPTVFWRRALTDRIGNFDTTYRLLGDCEYWLRAAVEDARLVHVPEVLAVQIDHGETLRSTQRDRLNQELEIMQRTYASRAGRPPSSRVASLKQSLRWRWFQLRFSQEFKKKEPDRWPRFIEYAREHGIRLGPTRAFLLNLLPIHRPLRSMWPDTEQLRHVLLEEFLTDR